ncbi:PAS domain-containing protein [Rivularia sp. UHCC 0363]|uniref:PAS domain-containing protein n=1 Tax=Rivularia sp. UHCC 0363 TaxID=3110244 RepID=UPI002B1EAB5A|nr:PAS domain-containing protein [Rivularia sp. UHCC 0363]MEA5596575.1 PAS domain-containing protein [Rivularia sp. UHCC 0363]
MMQQLTVLIIDNNLEDCQRYEDYLLRSDCSYTILSQSTGKAALDLCQKLHPDCILLEYLLPDMDGLEFVARLKQHKVSSPAIIITAHGNENVAVRAIKSGCHDYLVKEQLTEELLTSTVESVLEKSQKVAKRWCCSDERFYTSVENMLDSFGIFSSIRDEAGNIVDFRIDYMNAAACECNQMTTEEQLGKKLCEIFPGNITTGLFAQYCQVVETGEALVKEALIYKDFGQQQLTKVFDIRATKLGDGFVACWRDVTENKLSEQLLRESQQFVKRITDTTPGLLYVYDLVEQRNVYVNDQIGELLGYTPAEIQGMGKDLFPRIMHPDDLARVTKLQQRFDSAADGEILEIEYRLRHANGKWHWFYGKETVFNRNCDASPLRVSPYRETLRERQSLQVGEPDDTCFKSGNPSNAVSPQRAGSPRQIIGTVVDITNFKQIQEELRLSNERFQLATRAIDCVIYDWDITFNSIIRTEGLTSILGYSLEEIEPTIQWWMQLVHPEDKNNLFQSLQAVLANEEYYSFEYRVRHKAGDYRYVLDRGSVVRNAHSRPMRVVGLIADISDRKQAETALRESEAKFKQIVESNIIGIYFGDFNGKIHEANDSFLKTFGYSREELAAGSIYWNRMTPAEYFELDAQRIQELQQNGVCTPFEKEYFHKNGSRIPILLAIATIESQKAEGYSVCFVLDIRERKQAQLELRKSEERYRFLSEAVPQIVWSCNSEGEWEYISQRWFEYTGEPIQEAKNFGWLKFLHPDDVEPVTKIWQQSLSSGDHYEAEMRYRRSDGVYRWFLVRALPMKDEQGKVVKWFGTNTDIHELKQLEDIRRELLEREQNARNQAEAANRAKDDFVAMVSHDLRSPLNAILGWAKLLRTRNLDEAATTRALETIERNAKSQAKLLEDLLDTSRILQGTIQLDITQINLGETIKTAVENAYPVANVKSISIESIVDDSRTLIQGDTNRLQQVLGNLLSNAIKFTPAGGRIEVSLSVEREQDSERDEALPNYALITVSDTGIGINAEFLPYVFERYRQAEGTRRKGGLGLGLAITRHIVQLHGGTVEVSSRGEGQGCSFTIKLPI